MAKSDANIHHDGYNTDSTDEILPLGIYPEINVSYETTNANASPAIYFDSYGHAVVPLLGGIAIRDLNAEETQTLGYFSPKQQDVYKRQIHMGMGVLFRCLADTSKACTHTAGHPLLQRNISITVLLFCICLDRPKHRHGTAGHDHLLSLIHI